MAKRKRDINPFNLSFLDIMACGLGAVTLLFLLLKHSPDAVQGIADLSAETSLLAEEILEGERQQVELRNSIRALEQEIVEAQGLSDRVLRQIEERREELSLQADPEDEIPLLRRQVEELEARTAELREQGRGQDLQQFAGDGDRQYLTGLKLGGQRILFLVDASASMLAEDIVNVVRRRNMSDQVKRQSEKWQRAVRTVEWLMARIPPTSQFQIIVFDTAATPALAGSDGSWLSSADSRQAGEALAGLKARVPGGGTSLINAFSAIRTLSPAPDNVFLITDGLPTQGRTAPRKNTISGRERADLFNEAARALPRVPVNVILFPMEGDPSAAALFWQLGIASGGSFMSPATDWP
ncbi:MAG: VWA domain-containing protein [Porticoccaceae bacterium]|nr:VWA domain-containing protein [Porticoccaceae bacterium]